MSGGIHSHAHHSRAPTRELIEELEGGPRLRRAARQPPPRRARTRHPQADAYGPRAVGVIIYAENVTEREEQESDEAE